jgi:hypothetical protein
MVLRHPREGGLVAPLTDPIRLQAYQDALSNWSFADYIQFELTEQSQRWIHRELDDISLKEIGRLMHEHLLDGGKIDEVSETRPPWSGDYPYHYDFRFTIDHVPVYIETRLNYRLPLKPDESWILVVNVHAP